LGSATNPSNACCAKKFTYADALNEIRFPASTFDISDRALSCSDERNSEPQMRCYFLRDGHIAAVEVLPDGSDDDTAIKQSCMLFVSRLGESFDGFELWDRARKVYCYPEPQAPEPAPEKTGL
jgi:hypothetical protein